MSTINENISEIHGIVKEIKGAIEDKGVTCGCDPLETYPNKIRSIQSGGGKLKTITASAFTLAAGSEATAVAEDKGDSVHITFGIPEGDRGPAGLDGVWSGPVEGGGEASPGGRTIQVYTSSLEFNPIPEIQPPSKDGVTWDIETNELKGLTSTDDYKWEMNSPEDNKGYIWQSNANFDSDGKILYPYWSKPFRLTGEDGRNGTDGTSIQFAYTVCRDYLSYKALREHLDLEAQKGNYPLEDNNEDDLPANIKEGTIYNNIILRTAWTDHPTGVDDTNYPIELVTCRILNAETGEWDRWTVPTIWSKWGEDGMDGPGVEYIYIVTQEDLEDGKKVDSTWVQEHHMKDFDMWEKDPSYQEWEFVPNATWYNKWKDTYPEMTNFGTDWTDEPQDVSPSQPLEWVCMRRGRITETTTEDGKITTVVEWGPFDTPKLWGRYGNDGFAYKTSYVFTWAAEAPNTPIGGNFAYSYPHVQSSEPDDNGQYTWTKDASWSDTVPEKSDPNASIWMSHRTFRGDELNKDMGDTDGWFDSNWSKPTRMSDSSTFQVEFTTFDFAEEGKLDLLSAVPTFSDIYENADGKYTQYFTGGEMPKNPTDEDIELAWRNWWKDAPRGIEWEDNTPNAVYMATSSRHNGKWGAWSISKIKGEKGDAGANGTSVTIKGKFADEATLKTEWENFLDNKTSIFTDLTTGDGYLSEDKKELWVYLGNKEVNYTDAWENVGQLGGPEGPPGTSAFIYIAYANDSSGTDMILAGGEGYEVKPYRGIYASTGAVDENYLSNPELYKPWVKWRGEDGFGYEQVFIWTQSYEERPLLPQNCNELDCIPAVADNEPLKDKYYEIDTSWGWEDTAFEATEEKPFVWYAWRKHNGIEFKGWKGGREENTKEHALLYQRYSYDGHDAIHMDLTNDQIVIPIDDFGNIDSDFDLTTATSDIVVYVGDDFINDSHVIYTISPDVGSCADGHIVLDREKLISTENPSTIECTATYKGITYTKTLHIVRTKTAYDIKLNKAVLRGDLGDENYLYDDDKTVLVTARKWDGDSWIPANGKYLMVSYYHKDNSEPSVSSPAEYTKTVLDDSYEISLGDKKALSKVKFSLIDGSSPDAKELAFEEIGVVYNGEDGATEEFIYFLSSSSLEESELSQLNPTPKNTDGTNNLDYDGYQNKDWYPESGNVIWTDNPSGVSSLSQYEYVSKREKLNGKWQAFTTPVLWSRYGKDGVDGKDGTDGSPALVVQFQNPCVVVTRSSTGKLSTTTVTNYISAYQGTTQLFLYEAKLDDDWEGTDKYVSQHTDSNPLIVSEGHPAKIEFNLKEENLTGVSVLEIPLYLWGGGLISKFPITLTVVIQDQGGENAHYLNLSNDYMTVQVDEQGNPLNFSETCIVVTPYEGSNKVVEDGLLDTQGDLSLNCSNCDAIKWTQYPKSGFKITSLHPTKDDAKVDITYMARIKPNVTFQKTFYIKKSQETIEYELDVPGVIKSGETQLLNIRVKKISSQSESMSTIPIGYKVMIGGAEYKDISSAIDVSEYAEKITVQLYRGETLIDQEEIPIVADGATGARGPAGAKGENAQYYEIWPSVTNIIRKSTGETIYPTDSISVYLTKINGPDSVEIWLTNSTSNIPSGYKVFYQFDDGSIVHYTKAIEESSFNGAETKITFYLVKTASTSWAPSNPKQACYDFTEVLVLKSEAPTSGDVDDITGIFGTNIEHTYGSASLKKALLVGNGSTSGDFQITAGFNGGNEIAGTHGDHESSSLILFSGLENTSIENDLVERANMAATRLYNDGCFYTNSLYASGGEIGGFKISEDKLVGEYKEETPIVFQLGDTANMSFHLLDREFDNGEGTLIIGQSSILPKDYITPNDVFYGFPLVYGYCNIDWIYFKNNTISNAIDLSTIVSDFLFNNSKISCYRLIYTPNGNDITWRPYLGLKTDNNSEIIIKPCEYPVWLCKTYDATTYTSSYTLYLGAKPNFGGASEEYALYDNIVSIPYYYNVLSNNNTNIFTYITNKCTPFALSDKGSYIGDYSTLTILDDYHVAYYAKTGNWVDNKTIPLYRPVGGNANIWLNGDASFGKVLSTDIKSNTVDTSFVSSPMVNSNIIKCNSLNIGSSNISTSAAPKLNVIQYYLPEDFRYERNYFQGIAPVYDTFKYILCTAYLTAERSLSLPLINVVSSFREMSNVVQYGDPDLSNIDCPFSSIKLNVYKNTNEESVLSKDITSNYKNTHHSTKNAWYYFNGVIDIEDLSHIVSEDGIYNIELEITRGVSAPLIPLGFNYAKMEVELTSTTNAYTYEGDSEHSLPGFNIYSDCAMLKYGNNYLRISNDGIDIYGENVIINGSPM